MDAASLTVLILTLTAATFTAGWRAWQRIRFFLHMFQLESYKPPRYVRWVGTRGRTRVLRVSHGLGTAAVVAGALVAPQTTPFAVAVALSAVWCVLFASSRAYLGFAIKKPIVFTARMKRLATAAALIGALPVAAGAVAGMRGMGAPAYLAGWLVADLLAPLWTLLAAYALTPVEQAIQNGFKRQARATLRSRPDLPVVAITGSYGKTSVKFIVAEILRQRYNVLATPGSYNTPMGICLVVNNQLKPEHQLLVLEMGMRYRGDIRELCAIAPPDVGIVTAVGPAHLETMGTIENIATEKGDLIAHLKPDGVAVLTIDDPRVEAMASRAPGKVWRVSAEGRDDADIAARAITYSEEGTSFLVRDDTGQEHRFTTQLLGRHNVANLLLGIAVGRHFGLRLRQIAHAVARVAPVEHRLQLRRQGRYTIIDDAFNANPVGARHALEVLGTFTSGRRVVVTPGMVELGAVQYEENKAFGAHMATCVDLAVLIGEEQTRAIRAGLTERGFPEDRIRTFASFQDARTFLDQTLVPGDVALFENDLPDQYAAR